MRIFLIIIGLMATLVAIGQPTDVAVEVESVSGNELKILNAFPDSFPLVSVVFKAAYNQAPVWDLKMEDIQIFEDDKECEIISLEPISRRKAINISLVLDHSGSMYADYEQLYADGDLSRPLFSYGDNGEIILPDGYLSPLQNAKQSIENFSGNFNLKKDFLSLVGFSDSIDVNIPLTQDTAFLFSVLDTIQATYLTALYYAALAGLHQLADADGVSVEVLLTDGQDNVSEKNWREVAAFAQSVEIPVFVIGLGDVNVDTLSALAEASRGEFFYAERASSLDSIYEKISRKILSFYDLRYTSLNLASVDTSRQIRLEFTLSDDFVAADSAQVNLPEEVVHYLQQKEKQRKYLIYGGVATIILLVGGRLLWSFERPSNNVEKPLLIQKAYPNPTSGRVTVMHNAPNGFLVGKDTSGKEVFREPVLIGQMTIDLTGHQGMIIIFIESGIQVSAPVKIIVQ